MRSLPYLSIQFGAVIGLALALCCAAAAKAPEPVKPSTIPPMRIVVVKGIDASCGDTCPEWISAEGQITPDTLAEFRKVLKSLGSRKLPVFVKSNGGSVQIAMSIGRMLRARHLDVAVTQTIFEGCAPTDPKCARSTGFKGYRGTPTSALAFCASACSLLIAGGERRFVAWGSYVGVHEITVIEPFVNRKYQVYTREENGKKIEVSRTLISEKVIGLFKVDDAGTRKKLHDQMAKYFAEMGVGPRIMELTLATKPEDIHWMTRDELRETNLLTNYVGGETLVAVKSPPVTPQVAKVGVSLPPPVPSRPESAQSAPTIPTSSVEATEIPSVKLSEDYDIELNFSHRLGEPTVAWTAVVRKNGLTQAKWNFALRLDLGNGRGTSASPSISDLVTSNTLRGEMPLADYCEMARNSHVRVSLSAKQTGNYAMREIGGDPLDLTKGYAIWPDCAGSLETRIKLASQATLRALPATIDVTEISAVHLPGDYDIEFFFTHRPTERSVDWTAMVRKDGVIQPKSNFALRLDFGAGQSSSASTSMQDPYSSPLLRGDMSLDDYCTIARNGHVTVRLTTVQQSHFSGVISSEPDDILHGLASWAACSASSAANTQ